MDGSTMEACAGCKTMENIWNSNDIVGEVTNIVEKSIAESGFVYNRETGSYYNSAEKCYYVPEFKLYYYLDREAYYFYDEETGSLKYYASAAPIDRNEVCETAPCLRVVVVATSVPRLELGNVFIVTCNGGTLGREGPHDVLIPDINVSRYHCKFTYELKDGTFAYTVQDMNSKNGTHLNGTRVTAAELSLSSVIYVGSTVLLCHVHRGYETCPDCEGGNPSTNTNFVPHKYDLKQQYIREAKQIKKKFGLLNEPSVSPVRRRKRAPKDEQREYFWGQKSEPVIATVPLPEEKNVTKSEPQIIDMFSL